ncbi:MAG TPA: hypothetical protein VKI44_18610 [Acetobacteraceae bacterium]|nr:hypothetical protein [Acetobacteraceae bacterium]
MAGRKAATLGSDAIVIAREAGLSNLTGGGLRLIGGPEFRDQLRMRVEQSQKLDRWAAWFDKTPLVFVERPGADAEQSPCGALTELQLVANAPDRCRRRHTIDQLLLLAGGDKRDQRRDIAAALALARSL